MNNTSRMHLLWLWLCIAAAPASQPTGTSLTGRITTADGSPLPRMIVYLESNGPSRAFPAPPDAEISQKGATFSPSPLIISVGQTVLFRNDEDRPIEHNVFSRSPVQPFDLGLYRPPDAKRVTFEKPGVVRLFCSIHRLMDGVIFVCPTPFWTDVKPDGTYELRDVPPGEWTLKTWQVAARYTEQSMPVATGSDATRLDLTMTRK